MKLFEEVRGYSKRRSMGWDAVGVCPSLPGPSAPLLRAVTSTDSGGGRMRKARSYFVMVVVLAELMLSACAAGPNEMVDTGPDPAGCPQAVNTAGGADPWGGCFPGAFNTGVPDGTNLTAYGGSCTITTKNTTIDAKTVTCPSGLIIRAQNVTITNSLVNGYVFMDSEAEAGNAQFDGTRSLTITDSTIDAGDTPETGLGERDFVATRVEFAGGKRSAHCWINCTIRDSWAHDLWNDISGTHHESGFRMTAFSTFYHNSIMCDAAAFPPEAGCSADLASYGDFVTVENNTIERNLFGANVDMGYCAYGGSSASKPFPNAHHIKFRSNVFRKDITDEHGSPNCGFFGAVSDYNSSGTGNEFTDNIYSDGSAVSPDGG